MADDETWDVLDRKVVYDGRPWIEVSVERVRTGQGRIVENFYQVDTPQFAVVFAETPDGKVVTIRQYKHGARRVSLTLPGGIVDPGEEPQATACREFLEETGYRLAEVQHLGSFIPHGNFGFGKGHFFKGIAAEKVQEPDSGDLEAMELVLMDKDDVERAATDGRVVFHGVVTCILLALHAERQGS